MIEVARTEPFIAKCIQVNAMFSFFIGLAFFIIQQIN